MKRTLIALSLALAAAQAEAGIINGGFESGDLTGWTQSGFTGQNLVRDTTNHTTANYLLNESLGNPGGPTDAAVASQTTNFDGLGPGASPAVLPTEGSFLAFASNETSGGNNTLIGSALRQTFTVSGSKLTFDVQFLSNEALDSQWDFGGVALLDAGNNVLAQFTLDHDPTLGGQSDECPRVRNGGGRVL